MEVHIKFKPKVVGVYTQYWALQNESTGKKMLITLRGTGVITKTASKPGSEKNRDIPVEVFAPARKPPSVNPKPNPENFPEVQVFVPRGPKPPLPPSTQNKSNVSRYPPTLFCKEKILQYPRTFVGQIETQKVCVCNGTHNPMTIEVAPLRGIDIRFQ